MTMKTARKPVTQQPQCPRWCTRHHVGWHAGTVGTTEFGDKVVIRLVHGDSTPLISVDRARGASLNGLTFTKARALASLLADNECMDQKLASLLRDAADLITKPPKQPKRRSLFKLFSRRAVA